MSDKKDMIEDLENLIDLDILLEDEPVEQKIDETKEVAESVADDVMDLDAEDDVMDLDAEPTETTEAPAAEEAPVAEDDLALDLPDDFDDLIMEDLSEPAPKKHRKVEPEEELVDLQDEDLLEQPIEVPSDDSFDDLEFIHEEPKAKAKQPTKYLKKDEKKTTRRSQDKQEERKQQKIKKFKKNLPLILILIVAIIVALVLGNMFLQKYKEKKAEENKQRPVAEQLYEKDTNGKINDLLTAYYAAYAEGETDTIMRQAYPMTDREKSYIQMYSQYVESYNNVTCFIKPGVDENGFIVSVSYDLKLKDIDTTAPGLDLFYVRSGSDGGVYIDNAYSAFNLNYQENAMDDAIIALINEYQTGNDITALTGGVQTKYLEALDSDEALKVAMQETIPAAIEQWKSEQSVIDSQKTEDAQAQVDAENAAAAATVSDWNETPASGWVKTNDGVRIRQKPDANSEALTSVAKDAELQLLATTDNGWSKVKTGSITGYVKSEYISGGNAGGGESAPAASTESSSSTVKSFAEGTVIRITETCNIRVSMSETADKVGQAYSGESVKVIMSYQEGWTKVTWGDKTGYIKTEVLAGMQ